MSENEKMTRQQKRAAERAARKQQRSFDRNARFDLDYELFEDGADMSNALEAIIGLPPGAKLIDDSELTPAQREVVATFREIEGDDAIVFRMPDGTVKIRGPMVPL